MPFQPGHKKLGGRKKGSRNLLTRCHELGIDVFEEMVSLAQSEENPDKRFSKFRDLAVYVYPKPQEEINIEELMMEMPLEALEFIVMKVLNARRQPQSA